jgi:dCTP deaminase
MILSDREIKAAISRQAVSILPEPPEEAWSSTAVDLHLAPEIVLLRSATVAGVDTAVSPANPDFRFDELIRQFGQQQEIGDQGYVFKSGDFLLAWTIEKIKLPHRSRLAARVEGKSSLARLGVGVHVTAPTIHAGFGYKRGDDSYRGSPLQLEMWNCGPLDVRILKGMAICQLIFELVDGTPEKGYDGRFSVQGPSPPQQVS